MEDDIEYAWKIKDYISNQIQVADSKAGSVIAISTLNIALLVILPSDLSQDEVKLVALSSIPLFISLILAILCLSPRTPASSSGKIFWGNIAKYDNYSKYEADFKAASADRLAEVLKQIYYISLVAKYKYFWVSLAIKAQAIGISIFWLITFAVKLLHKN